MSAKIIAGLLATALLVPVSAAADVTAFWGVAPTPSSRAARGFALGVSLVLFGFEFEYSSMSEDLEQLAPSVKTGMVNGLIQTPTSVQFYVTAGGGFYRDRLNDDGETSFGTNIGGGVKMPLVGPLRLRLDYRVFTLRGEPIVTNPQRFYVGANLTF
jgi:hypothetical protein